VKFLTGFSQRPQHLLGTIGLISFLTGLGGFVYLLIAWIIRLWNPEAGLPIHQRALPMFALAALVLGAHLMSIGFLAELIIAYQSGDQLPYHVAETTPPREPTAP
jgi:hypothetical protein